MNPTDASKLPGIKLRGDEPVFNEPWEAQAFAMTMNLHQNGVFEWQEWADTLSREIHSGTVRSYYEHWLSALEKIVADKALTTIPDLAEVKSRWQQAAIETPHGQAIVLK